MDDKTLGVAQALIYKIQSTVDGGYRLTLDLPETELQTIKNLMDKKSQTEPLVLVCFMEKTDG